MRQVIAALWFVVGWAVPLESLRAAERNFGSLKFESTLHDFGQVSRGELVSQRFQFINAGDGVLSIQGVHASCGCTVVEVEQGRKYRPGETGVVEVRLNTTDFAGPLVKTVTIFTNQKLSPDRVLTVKAFVKSEIDADPPLADFGAVFSREGATQVVKVKPLGDFKLQVKGLTYNQQILDAQSVQEGADYRVTIKIKPGIVPGFLKENVVVRTNASHLQELSIPVRAQVRGNLDFSPNYLEFGVIPKTEVARRALLVSGVSPFSIKNTRLEMIVNGKRVDDLATVSRIDSTASEGEKKTVALELKNQGPLEGSVHGKLIVETSDSDQKEIVVDFYAFFR